MTQPQHHPDRPAGLPETHDDAQRRMDLAYRERFGRTAQAPLVRDDDLVDRLLADLARATGVSIATIRNRYGVTRG